MSSLFHKVLYGNNSLLTPNNRSTHAYVIGQPGVGKSRAMESWIMQDIVSGHGVGIIDPHGDLFQNIILRLTDFPEAWERIVIIDPCNKKWITTFNPLEAVSGFSQERLSLFLTDIIGKIWRLDVANAPRTMWLLSNSFLALSNLGLTLLDLPRFLLDRNFREDLLPRLSHSGARAYFEHEFPKNPAGANQWATPVLNKIGGLLFDPDTRLIIAGKSKVSFREMLDRKLILLVNLPKGIIGEGASALMGAFIVAHIQKAALARANTQNRVPFFLYLDEFQNYTTDNIIDILSESRKYSLSLTLAHQYLDQLSGTMRNAVLNTAGSIACFRVGYKDGYQLAKEVFPEPKFPASNGSGFTIRPPRLWNFPTFGEQGNTAGWDSLAQTLTKLRFREFWFRRRGPTRPSKHKTFNMPQPFFSTEVLEKMYSLFDTSGRLYSRLKKDVQEEVANHQRNSQNYPSKETTFPQQSNAIDDNSIWGV